MKARGEKSVLPRGAPGADPRSGPPVGAVTRRSLSDEVADQLREAIVSGAFQPGQRLREVDLSEALNVSRSPVRDALSRLEGERLLTINRFRGAVVAPMTLRDVEEVYSLRVVLETLAARLATQRADASRLARLQEAAALVPGGDQGERDFAGSDVAFHDLIYRLADHDHLYASWSLLRPHIFRFLAWRNSLNPDYREIYGSEHAEMAATIARGDAASAEALVAAHLRGAYERLVKALGADH